MANKNNGMSPLAAGVVGAAVGVAAGVAAVEFSDEKKRHAVAEKLGEIREGGEEAYSKLKETAEEGKVRIDQFSSMVGGKVDQVKGDHDK